MTKLSRRKFVVGGAIVAGGVIVMTSPGDKSGPRDPYFLKMQQALTTAGIAMPTLVIDMARLNANIDTLKADLPDGMGYRIVAKSLPSMNLLRHIRERTETDRLMTFNLPMLLSIAQEMPEADQLLGKPLPAAAVKAFYDQLPAENSAAAANIQWLVDTPERLREYQEIANAAGADMRINLELDVGLHRGGFEPGDALDATLEGIHTHNRLSFTGFMGYEPHIASIPTALGWRDRTLKGAWSLYEDALKAANSVFGESEMQDITRNAAGSPTYRLYKDTSLANEISVGSALVKPTHFDTELLEPFQEASFIATPVIKAMDQTQLPGLEFADGAQRMMDPNLDKTIFTYGGNWMAEPVDPPGLRYNSTFGRSSNQEMMNGGEALDVKPNDFVFLRPAQSEAVFLQFGDIAIYDDGAIVDQWPVFPASA